MTASPRPIEHLRSAHVAVVCSPGVIEEVVLGETRDGFCVVETVLTDRSHVFGYRYGDVEIAQASTLRTLAGILNADTLHGDASPGSWPDPALMMPEQPPAGAPRRGPGAT